MAWVEALRAVLAGRLRQWGPAARRWLVWFAVALAGASGPVRAQGLIEVYGQARESDPRFRAAQAEARASRAQLDQARAGFLPSAQFEATWLQSRQSVLKSNNPIFGAGVTRFPTDVQSLSITQPVFRMDVIERLRQARAGVRQAEFSLIGAEQDLILRTTAAYLALLAAQDALDLVRAEREAISRALDLAREKLKMGLGTVVNLHDATARFELARAREVEAGNKLNDARQALREITGRVVESPQRLKGEFPLVLPEPVSQDRWVSVALQQNLGVQARREATEVARQEVAKQRTGHYPTVNLQLSHNRRDTGSTLFGGGSLVDTTELTLKLTVPIYQGGYTSAVTREAVHRHQKSQEELELERRAVERQARSAYDGTVGGVALVKALEQTVLSQQSALEAKEQGFRSGLFTVLPVLDAQRDLYSARRDFANARYEYLLNRLKLKQAAGSLSESDLELVRAALQ